MIPCARCGSKPILKKIFTGRVDPKGHQLSIYEAVCETCGTKTIRHHYRKDTIRDWNQLQRAIQSEKTTEER